jgi:uncharacterized protein YozE (UPF0346 family)
VFSLLSWEFYSFVLLTRQEQEKEKKYRLAEKFCGPKSEFETI